ncbi:twin-arginine translocase TatA/TatE family subunit [Streptomyces sp. SS7]|uniref:twin-arginine translocase TatA/TatE family subunit n=1 Tax=Streptomyces sp. SS7 TaxID=3108485 RepID=UPI0030EE1BD2
MFGMSELALILVVVVVILAIKKLPELTRSAGKAARILKSESGALKDEDAPGRAPSAARIVPGAVVDRDDSAPRP